MSELGPEAREILRNGRDGDDPSPADKARIRSALFATIAAGAVTTAASSANAAHAANAVTEVGMPASVGLGKPFLTPIFGGLFGKGMLILLLGAAGAGGYAVWSHHQVKPPVVTSHSPDKPHAAEITKPGPSEPVLPVEVVPEKRDEPAPVVSVAAEAPKTGAIRSSVQPNSPKESEVPEESADSLLAETQRLREAHGAMRGGDPEKALALLSEQAAENEGQKLQAERAAARVLALCKLGRVDEAHAEAAAFLAQNPQSPLADRVRKACPKNP